MESNGEGKGEDVHLIVNGGMHDYISTAGFSYMPSRVKAGITTRVHHRMPYNSEQQGYSLRTREHEHEQAGKLAVVRELLCDDNWCDGAVDGVRHSVSLHHHPCSFGHPPGMPLGLHIAVFVPRDSVV